VNVGPGGQKVEVENEKGSTTVEQGSGNVNVKSGSGAVKVGAGGAVDITGAGGTATVTGTGAAAGSSGALNLLENGKTVEHTCTQGEAINVAGNANTLTLHGPCAAVNLNGNKNTLAIDSLGTLNAMGNQNTVTWKAALSGKAPQVNSLGTGNKVSQAK
jgi:hypothetical protein